MAAHPLRQLELLLQALALRWGLLPQMPLLPWPSKIIFSFLPFTPIGECIVRELAFMPFVSLNPLQLFWRK
jgi:hypothetical protein